MTAAGLRRLARRLRGDARGSTLVEYALLLPVQCVLFMGLGELAYQGYMKSVLTGAMQKAGRDSTIQGNEAKSSEIDKRVMESVNAVSKGATYESSRKNYSTFGNIKPEAFDDNDDDDTYDKATECFYDVNGNKSWDVDPGTAGQGGASDVVVYTITVRYPRLFPVAQMIGMTGTAQMSATTTLKNQPYASQTVSGTVKICPK